MVGPVGEDEVTGGKTTFRVGGQGESHLVPPDIDIRVVVSLLSLESNPRHETHRFAEVLEHISPGDLVALSLPLRVSLQEGFNFVIRNQ